MKTDILIVGAGFAGASTAYHLSRQSGRSIVIVDKEEVPGFHASGRNASLLMQGAEIPDIRRLIVRSRQAFERVPNAILDSNGSILLGKRSYLDGIREPDNPPSEYLNPDAVRQRIPLLEGHPFEAALFTASDAVIDIAALLNFYLHEAQQRGVKLNLSCRVEEVSGDGPFQIRSSQGTIEANTLVNAAGAWAPEVATLAGATSLPLNPLKRHLFVLGNAGPISRDWPFVWNFDRSFYFRRESGNLLFSICDEQRCSSLEPTVEPEIAEDLAQLIWAQLPALREAVQVRTWSCFRTKTPDGCFALGWDLALENFFWAAGLGGHGMGSSWEVGRLCAEQILDREAEIIPPAFSPRRFAEGTPPAKKTTLET